MKAPEPLHTGNAVFDLCRASFRAVQQVILIPVIIFAFYPIHMNQHAFPAGHIIQKNGNFFRILCLFGNHSLQPPCACNQLIGQTKYRSIPHAGLHRSWRTPVCVKVTMQSVQSANVTSHTSIIAQCNKRWFIHSNHAFCDVALLCAPIQETHYMLVVLIIIDTLIITVPIHWKYAKMHFKCLCRECLILIAMYHQREYRLACFIFQFCFCNQL